MGRMRGFAHTRKKPIYAVSVRIRESYVLGG